MATKSLRDASELADSVTSQESAAIAADSSEPVRVAYLINQYPKVSHTFIRREMMALQKLGVKVDRIAIRGWDGDFVDPQDFAELSRTQFVMKGGILPILVAAIRCCLAAPRRFFSTLWMSLAMSRKSERSLPYHLIYLAQACLVLEWVNALGSHHLHAHFGTNSAEVAMLVKLLGGPAYSFTAHGSNETDRGDFLNLDKKVRYAKFAAAVSSYTRSQLLRRVDLKDWSKVKVVHCGLEADYYNVPAITLPAEPRFVCVGRLSSEKGQLVLIEAMGEVCKSYPNAELVLVGDGPTRAMIERRIEELGLSDRIRITGWLTGDGVKSQIEAARVFVLPSFQEGLPIVIMEAMALKRPVIATHVAGIPELVHPGENGWLVPAGSVADLAEAMKHCLSTSDEELMRMGEAAHSRAAERHTVEFETIKLASYFRGTEIL